MLGGLFVWVGWWWWIFNSQLTVTWFPKYSECQPSPCKAKAITELLIDEKICADLESKVNAIDTSLHGVQCVESNFLWSRYFAITLSRDKSRKGLKFQFQFKFRWGKKNTVERLILEIKVHSEHFLRRVEVNLK